MKQAGIKYSKYNPNMIYFLDGEYPHLVNKNNDLISHHDAGHNFKKAFNTMMTWAARYYTLTINLPLNWNDEYLDRNYGGSPRQHELERLSWDLEEIESWISSLRVELDKQMGVQGMRELLEKVKRLEERPGSEGERQAAAHQRKRLEEKLGDV